MAELLERYYYDKKNKCTYSGASTRLRLRFKYPNQDLMSFLIKGVNEAGAFMYLARVIPTGSYRLFPIYSSGGQEISHISYVDEGSGQYRWDVRVPENTQIKVETLSDTYTNIYMAS